MILGRNMPASNHGSIPQSNRFQVVPKSPIQISPSELDMQQLATHQNAQMQKFQIDAAIRLLQMQYNSIMARVITQNTAVQERIACVVPPAIHLPQCVMPTLPARSDESVGESDQTSRSQPESRKRGRDESYDSANEVVSAGSSHGKVVLTCEVSYNERNFPLILCTDSFLVADCLRNLQPPAKGLGKKRREIRFPELSNRLALRRHGQNRPRHLVSLCAPDSINFL
jgi:hypothetical protein